MKSIAIINGSRKNDGMTHGSLAYFQMLTRRGYNVKWYQIVDTTMMDEYPSGGIVLKGRSIINYSVSNGMNRLLFLKREARKIGEDIILLTDPTLMPLFKDTHNLLVKFHDFRPFSEFNDNFLTRVMYWHILPLMRETRFGIFTTKYMEEQARLLGIDPLKKYIIPEPVISSESPAAHLNNSIQKVESKKITFAYLATDRPYKNINFFLQLASRYISDNGKRFILLSRLKNIRRIEIERDYPNVILRDHCEDIRDFYDEADVLLYPSLYEGFGRPIVEAMSYGIPVIATDIEPFREITGGNSILCPKNSPESWVEEIDRLADPGYYKDKAVSSLERFDYFGLDKAEERLLNMIDDI